MRIKTKQEFLKEFGENWEHDVLFAFVPEMYPILGKKVSELTTMMDESITEEYKDTLYCAVSIDGVGPFLISYDMITEE